MNDEIIRMAREAHGPITGQWWDMDAAALERFAALVAAAEREACANDWEALHGYDKHGVAAAIRARGNV